MTFFRKLRGPNVEKLKAAGDGAGLAAVVASDEYKAPVRVLAARALADVGDARALPVLIPAMASGCDDVAAAARATVEALGTEAAPHLGEALGDSDPSVGRSAMGLLVGMGAAALVVLVPAVESGNATQRQLATWALGDLGENDGDGATRAAVRQALLGALDSADHIVRGNAAVGLGQLADSTAVEALVERLADEEEKVRTECRVAIDRIGPPGVPALLVALDDADLARRQLAAWVLGDIGERMSDGEPRALVIRHLHGALADDDAMVRTNAAVGLGQLGAQESASAIVGLLSDRAAPPRKGAAVALGMLAAPGVVSPLVDLLQDAERDVRAAAAESLVSLYQSGTLDEAERMAVLEQRDFISRGHTDSPGAHTDTPHHWDQSSYAPASDCNDNACSVHEDQIGTAGGTHGDRQAPHSDVDGLGLDFPL